MTTIFISGLLLGAIGSVHCIGMCGPIALSLPVVSERPSSKFLGTLLYNAGRIFTYAVLGALFGLVGSGFSIIGLQQWLSISLGLLILVFLVVPSRHFTHSNLGSKLMMQLRQNLARFFARRNYESLFSIGLLNGILPCGMVYMAVAAAIATSAVAKSSLFMAAFGLGTLPVMWSLSFFWKCCKPAGASAHKKTLSLYHVYDGCLAHHPRHGTRNPLSEPGRRKF